ncbi:ribonuclease P protein subunit p29 isoform X5 [Acanthochromis polyacanthus]|uniref:ribonuclease P protein subunit p29 isoform X5 n=1 Tax=Acanthochromis polyacanthus TaxID=80966 RepID=UPI00223456B9|nr:ribonuclease P protein subunit p29 isoform X5 [Acanthochromis polyacanthus]
MDAEVLVQAPVPHVLEKVLGVESQAQSKAAAFTKAFLKNSIQQPARHDLKSMLTHKAVILGYIRPKKKKTKRNSKKAKGLNARQKKAMKIFQLKPEHQRYELFLPLQELWRQYIIELCSGLKPTSPQFVQQKLLKADLHGAILTVIPKRNSVFAVEINGFVSHIYGSKFEQRASERSAKKFKVRGTIDL